MSVRKSLENTVNYVFDSKFVFWKYWTNYFM